MKQQPAARPSKGAAKNPPKKPAPVTGSSRDSSRNKAGAKKAVSDVPPDAAPAAAAVGSTRAALGGWLEGPRFDADPDEQSRYRGERLGLPESGPGALAGQGRRLGALCVDWAIAYLIVLAIGWRPSSAAGQWGVVGIFAAEHVLLLSTLGYTIGKRLFGTRVGKLGGPITPLHVLGRTVLLLLVIPAVIWDRDGRGLHDRLVGTVEVLR
ncbi:MAG TPA: RDD family protein [Actinocrinis sp.]|jgi:hypothetical protein